jgi:DNA-binding transcriptional regulator YhcF (GntR family)
MKIHLAQSENEANKKLIEACLQENFDKVQEALEEGADVYHNDGEALDIVCNKNPNPQIVYLLINHQPDFQKLSQWNENNSNKIENNVKIKECVISIKPFSQKAFHNAFDPKGTWLSNDGFCSGVSLYYATRENNKKNFPGHENQGTLDKLLNLDSQKSTGILYKMGMMVHWASHLIPKISTNNGKSNKLNDLGAQCENNKTTDFLPLVSKAHELLEKNGITSFLLESSQGGHVMIITKINDNCYTFFDPNIGEIRINGLNALNYQIQDIYNLYEKKSKSKNLHKDIFDCVSIIEPFHLNKNPTLDYSHLGQKARSKFVHNFKEIVFSGSANEALLRELLEHTTKIREVLKHSFYNSMEGKLGILPYLQDLLRFNPYLFTEYSPEGELNFDFLNSLNEMALKKELKEEIVEKLFKKIEKEDFILSLLKMVLVKFEGNSDTIVGTLENLGNIATELIFKAKSDFKTLDMLIELCSKFEDLPICLSYDATEKELEFALKILEIYSKDIEKVIELLTPQPYESFPVEPYTQEEVLINAKDLGGDNLPPEEN